MRLGRRRHAPRRSRARRTQGGWNIFITWARRQRRRQPDRARRPCRDRRDGLVRLAVRREARAAARQMGGGARRCDARKAVARELQENAWNFVPHVYLGQWVQPGRLPLPTSAAWCRCPRSCRGGTSRRREAVTCRVRRIETSEQSVMPGPDPASRPAVLGVERRGRQFFGCNRRSMIAYHRPAPALDHSGHGGGRDLRLPAAASRARRSGGDHRRRQRDRGLDRGDPRSGSASTIR